MATRTLSRYETPVNPGFLAWLGLLGVLIAIGALAAYEVLTKGLIVTNLTDSVPWGLWITVDLSAIALGAGAFTLSAVVYLFRLERFRPIVRLAVLVGIIGYTSALLTLIMDIGRPDRFWHPWVYWNVHSVLWEITWCITIYLTIMMVEFAPILFELKFFDRWPWLRRLGYTVHKAAPVLALLGLGISLLHQSSLGATYGVIKARPIWFKPSMPIMFIISAVAVGPAVTMAAAHLVEWIRGRKLLSHAMLRSIARFSAFGLLAYAYIKLWDLAAVSYYASTPGSSTALNILNEYTPFNFGFWVGEILLGIVIPVILFLVPRFNRNPANLVMGGLLAGLGIVAHRWNTTVSGLVVPLDYAPGTAYQLEASAYAPSLVEWGIVIGVIGYALLVFTIGVRFLPIFSKSKTH